MSNGGGSGQVGKLFMSIQEVQQALGVSESTIRRMEQKEQFPKRRQVASGRMAWLAREIVEWCENRPTRTQAA
jgi:predicted DNA-binding transcriptional regulator AlpA